VLTIANPVVNVSVGRSVSAALDDSGLLWAWGTNQNGELGVGDNEPRGHPFPILSLKGKKVTSVHCGDDYVMCLG
jgi:X-linked retinitis pigmentosa GTPase regulator